MISQQEESFISSYLGHRMNASSKRFIDKLAQGIDDLVRLEQC